MAHGVHDGRTEREHITYANKTTEIGRLTDDVEAR